MNPNKLRLVVRKLGKPVCSYPVGFDLASVDEAHTSFQLSWIFGDVLMQI